MCLAAGVRSPSTNRVERNDGRYNLAEGRNRSAPSRAASRAARVRALGWGCWPSWTVCRTPSKRDERAKRKQEKGREGGKEKGEERKREKGRKREIKSTRGCIASRDRERERKRLRSEETGGEERKTECVCVCVSLVAAVPSAADRFIEWHVPIQSNVVLYFSTFRRERLVAKAKSSGTGSLPG